MDSTQATRPSYQRVMHKNGKISCDLPCFSTISTAMYPQVICHSSMSSSSFAQRGGNGSISLRNTLLLNHHENCLNWCAACVQVGTEKTWSSSSRVKALRAQLAFSQRYRGKNRRLTHPWFQGQTVAPLATQLDTRQRTMQRTPEA